MLDNKQDPYNLAIVVCYSSKDYIVLEKSQPRFKEQRPSKMLVIDRNTMKIVNFWHKVDSRIVFQYVQLHKEDL